MDIKIGEYVRTEQGEIVKVLGDDGNRVTSENFEIYFKNEIVKHSFNIIDLIEVGDYVNGRLVLQVDYKNKNICLLIPFTDTKSNTNIMWYGYEEIKSIVTHEQFKNIEYKVGK